MSLYVSTVVKKTFSLSRFIKTCSKFHHLIKNIKNTNTACIELSFNHKHIELDTHNLLNNLKVSISSGTDYKTFEAAEKTLQISSMINSVIDQVQATFLANAKKNQAVINSKDRLTIFKNAQSDCDLQESDIQIDAAQPFTKQLLQNDPKVKEATQYLKLNPKSIDLSSVNADSKATTKYVVEQLNDIACKNLYPDIDFSKIRESAAQSTRHILENKLSKYHCKKIDYYILRTEGTAV
ncbi:MULTISPECIES: hypothetical protein [Providencia]|uniref:hypothetical protein n=1 Tax=Providencia TaxID=586 RepID=UPI0019802BB3|nr:MULTISPECIES: hypothetical protein [Providencia]MBN4867502.1 hypothetical protein [Providencia stuartii]MBN4876583.1 hypothetical protein [Providencia stuartii]MBN4881517.1 hypothetical protein [Providencia stuartii]MBN4886032.1 hypothetical protein [Providencia stuartii]